MKFKHSIGTPRRAFSLVEVTLALGIAAFCLIPLIALLPVGLNSNQAALQQTAAAVIAQAVVSDLRATPASVGATFKSPRYFFNMPSVTLPAGSLQVQTVNVRSDGGLSNDSIAIPGPGSGIASVDALYKVCVTYVTLGPSPKAATPVRVLVIWPPQACPSPNTIPRKFSGSFEAMFALPAKNSP